MSSATRSWRQPDDSTTDRSIKEKSQTRKSIVRTSTSNSTSASSDSYAVRNAQTKQTNSPRPSPASISPVSFYGNESSPTRKPNPRMEAVKKAAAETVVRQMRRDLSTGVRLQRAAFKDVTSLKTWPLQELALGHLDDLYPLHKTATNKNIGIMTETTRSSDQEYSGHDSDSQSDAASTDFSTSSLDEPKRTKRHSDDEEVSPRKSTLRLRYRQDFSTERDLPSPLHDDLHSDLWCLEPRIFAVEKSKTGKRRYMVGHLGRFLDYYWRKCDPLQRHYYELIREKTPCRLYFDLEFSKLSNPDIDDETTEVLMTEFLVELAIEFDRHYGLPLPRCNVVDLDSSTAKKFSRHLIVHLPGDELYPDAAAVGRFVRVLVGRLATEVASGQLQEKRPTLASHLFVYPAPSASSCQDSKDSSGNAAKSVCFIDLGVYTRNRLFRLLGSCKYGKSTDAMLRIASTNEFRFPDRFTNDSFYSTVHQQQQRQRKEEEVKCQLTMSSQEVRSFPSCYFYHNVASVR